jgi:hypothetical protein
MDLILSSLDQPTLKTLTHEPSKLMILYRALNSYLVPFQCLLKEQNEELTFSNMEKQIG